MQSPFRRHQSGKRRNRVRRLDQEDVKWLGYQWDNLFYASDYFDQLYEWAIKLIKAGKAYVDDLTAEQIREYRGTLTEPGKDSPYRNRSVEENLNLFERMKAGEFPDGSRVLRAKIDMSSPNLNMRDPVMYRILHAEHHRTGNKWCIYPMYDYAHGQSDSLGEVTYSMCSLEFADHQPIYRWYHRAVGNFPLAANRIRPSEPDLHHDEQAQAAPARRGRARQAAGTIRACPRSPACAAAATPRSNPQFCRSGWSVAHQRLDRTGHAGALRPRRLEQARSAGDGGAASVESSDR